MSVEDFLDKCPNDVSFEKPFVIEWSETSRGFGQYQFYINPVDNKIHIDNEFDSKETIKRILCKMVDDAILDDQTFHEMKEIN